MNDSEAWLGTDSLTEGVWQIDTETSTYVYDVDLALLARLPGGAGSLDGTPIGRYELRRDGDNVPVIHAPTPLVGRPWLLRIDLRGDGVTTLRRTTNVCHIVRLT